MKRRDSGKNARGNTGSGRSNSPRVETVFWGVPGFPSTIKNEFMGVCKIQGKHYKMVLENLIKAWLYDVRKGRNPI